MKRILITGAGSYIGTEVKRRLTTEPHHFEVHELSVRGLGWRAEDFSKYDAILHVAGVAHISTDPTLEPLYMKVNRDLTVEVAQQAKAHGVKQFIFMSSSIVYGESRPHTIFEPITATTPVNPSNFYGLSKVQAEESLQRIEGDGFSVAILRCPMIYGPSSKGNFPQLIELARRLPVFPDIPNRRSMLYVGNLAELVANLAIRGYGGTYLPQNSEYSSTSQLVKMLGNALGKEVHLTKLFNPVLGRAIKKNERLRKAFGNLFYDRHASELEFDYTPYSLNRSIREIAAMEDWES